RPKSSSWGGDSRERCSQLGAGPDADVEVLSRGAGGDRERSWRAAGPVPIVGNGSGTEVSSLTADYQRSRGCGTEEASGSPGVGLRIHPDGLALLPLRELRLLRLEDEARHPEPLDDQVVQDLVPDLALAVRHPISGLVRRQLEAQLDEAPPSLLALLSRGLRSEEHTSELQSLAYLVCRLLLEKKKKKAS